MKVSFRLRIEENRCDNVLNPLQIDKFKFELFQSEKNIEDDNFKFYQYGGKVLKKKKLENTGGKGEIARYEQFLLFLQRFRKTCTEDMQKQGLVCERVIIIIALIIILT